MKFRLFSSFLVFFTIFCIISTSAHAFLGKSKIPPLKNDVSISKQEFEEKSFLLQETPFDDKSLAYKIRLPNGWTKQDIIAADSGTAILSQIAGYISPPRIEHRSIFRMSAVNLASFINADDWFIAYMLEMGFSIEGMTVQSSRLVSAQYTVFEQGEPYVVRATIAISGPKIILAEYLVHQEAYEAEQSEQVWAMTGFSLVSPDKSQAIATKTFNFVDIAKFDYPKNWTILAPDITDINRMEASILNTVISKGDVKEAETELVGRIDVSLIAKNQGLALKDEINLLKESLKKRNYKLGKFIETIPVDKLNELIQSSRVDVYQVEGISKKLAGYEYWVGVLQSKGRYYLIRLTTVSRGENFKTWAENVETYKFLLRSLGPASVQTEDEDVTGTP